MARRHKQQTGQHASHAEWDARERDGPAMEHINVDEKAPEMEEVDQVDPIVIGSDIFDSSKHTTATSSIDSSNIILVRITPPLSYLLPA